MGYVGENHRERICKRLLECLVVAARKQGTANYAIASLHSAIVAATVDEKDKGAC